MHELCVPVVYGNMTEAEAKRQALQLETRLAKADSAAHAKENRVNFVEAPLPEGLAILMHCENQLTPKGDEMLMMVGENMRIAIATTATDKATASADLTQETVEAYINRLNNWIKRDFRLTRPRLAILSLNESDEQVETDVLMPAIEQVIGDRVNAFGPFPAKEFFAEGDYQNYDGILAFYPRQAEQAFRDENASFAVCYLAGQEMVQTAPVQARDLDFTNAIYLAFDIRRNRIAYDKAYANPLQKLFHDKREERRS